MKNVFLSVAIIATLSACGTLGSESDSSPFQWSDLNPFSESDTVQTVEIDGENTQAPSAPDVSVETALTTEMNELAMLTSNDNARIRVEDVLNGSVQRTEDGKDIVAVADITQAETAEAVPTEDVTSMPTKDSIEWRDTLIQSSNECPRLSIMPEANSLTKFDDEAMENKTASAKITEARMDCAPTDGGKNITVSMMMSGMVTDLGRYEGNRDLEAFITFPYFISVSDPSGLAMDKDIEATALKFKPMIDTLDHVEEITYFIPMDDVSQAPQYEVTVGFQLNRKELEYNRSQGKIGDKYIGLSPTIKPTR